MKRATLLLAALLSCACTSPKVEPATPIHASATSSHSIRVIEPKHAKTSNVSTAHMNATEIQKAMKNKRFTVDDFPNLVADALNANYGYTVDLNAIKRHFKDNFALVAQAHSPRHGMLYLFKNSQLIHIEPYVGSPAASTGNRVFEGDGENPTGLFPMHKPRTHPKYHLFAAINTARHARAQFKKHANLAGQKHLAIYEKLHGKVDSYKDQIDFNAYLKDNGFERRMYFAIGLHSSSKTSGYPQNEQPWTDGCFAISRNGMDRIANEMNAGNVKILVIPHNAK